MPQIPEKLEEKQVKAAEAPPSLRVSLSLVRVCLFFFFLIHRNSGTFLQTTNTQIKKNTLKGKTIERDEEREREVGMEKKKSRNRQKVCVHEHGWGFVERKPQSITPLLITLQAN